MRHRHCSPGNRAPPHPQPTHVFPPAALDAPEERAAFLRQGEKEEDHGARKVARRGAGKARLGRAERLKDGDGSESRPYQLRSAPTLRAPAHPRAALTLTLTLTSPI